MFTDARVQVLLFEDALNLCGHPRIQHHVSQPALWIADMQQVREFATGLGQRHQLAGLRAQAARFRGVDHVTQFFGEFAMSNPCLMRRDLHCHGVELPIVTRDVRLH